MGRDGITLLTGMGRDGITLLTVDSQVSFAATFAPAFAAFFLTFAKEAELTICINPFLEVFDLKLLILGTSNQT